jgi:hypothetical protein
MNIVLYSLGFTILNLKKKNYCNFQSEYKNIRFTYRNDWNMRYTYIT